MSPDEKVTQFVIFIGILSLLAVLWVKWPEWRDRIAGALVAIRFRLAGPTWWHVRVRDEQTRAGERLRQRVQTLERLSVFSDAALIELRLIAIEAKIAGIEVALAARVPADVSAPAPPRAGHSDAEYQAGIPVWYSQPDRPGEPRESLVSAADTGADASDGMRDTDAVSPGLGDDTVIATIAAMRRADGGYRFSANQIAALVGGNRNMVLSRVRETRAS